MKPACTSSPVILAALVIPSLAAAQSPGSAPQPARAPLESAEIPTEPSADHPNAGTRAGWTFGLSIGRGSIDVACSRCNGFTALTEALSLTAHVGRMITPTLAVGVEHWTVRYNDRGSEWFDDSADHLVAQRITTVSAQAWLGNRLWFKAGAGVGKHISDLRYARLAAADAERHATGDKGAEDPPLPHADDEPNEAYIPAFTAAVGFEFARRTDVAVDVQVRVGTTRGPSDEFQVHNTGVVFGVSWF